MSLLTPADMNSYGGTGTHSAADLQLAIDLAEFDIGQALGTFLSPTTVSNEEYIWPMDNTPIMLKHVRVTSIVSVTAKHSLDADCNWTTDDECGVILDGPNGLIQVVAKTLSLLTGCNCASGYFPDRAVISYIAGYTAAETANTTALGKALRMAIALRARDWLKVLDQGDNFQGNYSIKSWSSMDYSEQLAILDKMNPLGVGPLSQEAWMLLRRFREYPAIMLKGSGRF